MAHIRCIIVDDEPLALQKMQKYVEQIPYLDLIASCSTPVEAIKVLAETEVDAIFTDINMLGLNGLDFVSSLSSRHLVVFVTAYSEYAVDSYGIGAVDYIVKPYGLKEFQRAAERVRAQYEMMNQGNDPQSTNSLFVRSDNKWKHVKTENIRYIQGLSDYLCISMADNSKPLVTYSTFAQILNRLPSTFIQVHRSWVVNVEHIVEITRNRIVMDKETYIPISDTYKEQLLQYLEGMSVGKSGKAAKVLD